MAVAGTSDASEATDEGADPGSARRAASTRAEPVAPWSDALTGSPRLLVNRGGAATRGNAFGLRILSHVLLSLRDPDEEVVRATRHVTTSPAPSYRHYPAAHRQGLNGDLTGGS